MARVNGYFSFRVCHKTALASVIRGHQVYMSVWSAAVGEKLFAAPDPREEAREYDKFAVGLYKEENDQKLLSAMYRLKYQICVITSLRKVRQTI